jgi:Domain of unknown function (DUF4936)
LYVYYRVHAAAWQDALAAVQRYQQRLRSEHPGLTARVLRRAEEQQADAVTLMEVYRIDGDARVGINGALQAQIESAATALAPWLVGTRHTERFDALD